MDTRTESATPEYRKACEVLDGLLKACTDEVTSAMQVAPDCAARNNLNTLARYAAEWVDCMKSLQCVAHGARFPWWGGNDAEAGVRYLTYHVYDLLKLLAGQENFYRGLVLDKASALDIALVLLAGKEIQFPGLSPQRSVAHIIQAIGNRHIEVFKKYGAYKWLVEMPYLSPPLLKDLEADGIEPSDTWGKLIAVRAAVLPAIHEDLRGLIPAGSTINAAIAERNGHAFS